ncbi:MAG: hypothetical protein R2770_05350 [Acidimicrobiales bacterium]|nr:hypothetical protein [Acidimicrobiales bacterium]
MATSRTSYGKLQRDRAKKEKAELKRARRMAREDDPEAASQEKLEANVAADPAALLAQVEELHRQFEADEIDFDTFEDRKLELMEQLTLD